MKLARCIPNGLSLLRLGMGLMFPMVPVRWRIPFILLAAGTDCLDGFLARVLDANSDTGRWLDPIADKVFVLSLLLTLIAEGALSPGWAAAVLARDNVVAFLAIGVGVRRRRAEWQALKPRPFGKITTACQFALLLTLVVNPSKWFVLQVVAAGFSLLSAADYLVAAIRHWKQSK